MPMASASSGRNATSRILKLTLGRSDLEPRPGSRGIALVTDRFGQIVCLWDVTEPELKRCFEGRDYGYFFAEGEEMKLTPAPDQAW